MTAHSRYLMSHRLSRSSVMIRVIAAAGGPNGLAGFVRGFGCCSGMTMQHGITMNLRFTKLNPAWSHVLQPR